MFDLWVFYKPYYKSKGETNNNEHKSIIYYKCRLGNTFINALAKKWKVTKKWPKWPTVTNEGGHFFRLWNPCNYYVFTTMTKWPLKISKKKWFNIYSSKKVCQKSLVIWSQGALSIGITWIEGDQRVTNVTKMTNFSGH